MANVLEKIVADKRQEIAQRKVDFPLAHFKDGLTPSTRSFFDALNQPNAGYILECKKASPSKGLIRDDFNLDEIIEAYLPYAACISVLTDEKYFQGKFEYLEYVRERVTQPVINKDFFVEPYQVYLARHHNADAILLMLSVLNDEEYRELADIAHSLDLDVLTEVSNEEEAHRAVALKAKIIGINNRNLRDLSTDLATTEHLVPLINQASHEHVIISESGIYTHQDVRRLSPIVDGFLVGSALMAEDNVAQAVKRLVYGTVKVCGMTRAKDATDVATMGASYAGLIFAEKSKRYLSLDDARDIVAAVPFDYVGVFVDANIALIVEYATTLGLVAVQLHGSESQSYITQLRAALNDANLAGCQIWLAKGITDTLPALDEDGVDRFVLDCKVGDQSGGTGQAFDWQLFAQADLSAITRSKIILAGGINVDNAQHAAGLGLGGIDLNSGVEDAPGKKSEQKLQRVFEKLRVY